MNGRRNMGWALCALVLTATTPLAGCLKKQGDGTTAEDEEKQFIVGRWAFKRLEQVETAVAENKLDEAKEVLAEMKAHEDLNPHERALMYQQLGNIYASEQNYPAALEAFAACYAEDALPEASQRSVQYNLGQLYALTGQYDKSVELLEAWAKDEKDLPREIKLMLANSHVQLGHYEAALPYAEAILASSEQREENLLQLMLAIRFELKQYDEVIALLTELVERYPKKAYWLQLSAAYGQVGQDKKALAVMELAHRQDLLTEESELMTLAQLYLHVELPFEAATLMTEQMEAGRVSRSPRNLELLANAWMAARDIDKALAVLSQAADKADSGEAFLRLGQLQMQQERWREAQSALQRAVKRGGLKDEGSAMLLLGNASYELGQRSAARQAFQSAAKHERQAQAAAKWLAVMEKEDASCPTGKEAACKLIPGQ